MLFSVFTNISFALLCLDNCGTSVGNFFDSPPRSARSELYQEHVEYWEQATRKRLIPDALVALVWSEPAGVIDIYLGTVVSMPEALIDSARRIHD